MLSFIECNGATLNDDCSGLLNKPHFEANSQPFPLLQHGCVSCANMVLQLQFIFSFARLLNTLYNVVLYILFLFFCFAFHLFFKYLKFAFHSIPGPKAFIICYYI